MLSWNENINLRDGTHKTLEDYIKSLGEAGLEQRVKYLEDHAYLGGNLVVNGNLAVNGAAAVTSNATIYGAVEMGSSLQVTGNISTVWGKIDANGDGVAPTEPI